MVAVFFSCSHESQVIDDIPEICFGEMVLPVFVNGCALSGCHDAASAEGSLVLDSWEGIRKAVRPGDPGESPVYTSIIAFRGAELMPPGNPLTLQQRSIIRVWIEQGAKNTQCPDTTVINPDDTAVWVNPEVCFQRDLLPVFLSSCGISGCHDPSGAQGEIILTTYPQIYSNLTAFNPEESEIYEKITEDNPGDIMPPPPYNPLPQETIDSIYQWILKGAKDEYCGPVCDTSESISYNNQIKNHIQTNCISCHSGAEPNGGVSLTSYEQVKALGEAGILAGVLSGKGYPLMPPGRGLSACKIRQFEIWAENEYPPE